MSLRTAWGSSCGEQPNLCKLQLGAFVCPFPFGMGRCLLDLYYIINCKVSPVAVATTRLVTSGVTRRDGFPYSILNGGGVLDAKAIHQLLIAQVFPFWDALLRNPISG